MKRNQTSQPAARASRFRAGEYAIEVNGVVVGKSTVPALASGGTWNELSIFTYKFPSAGTYTVSLVVNYGDAVRETNTTNNTFTRTVTVD